MVPCTVSFLFLCFLFIGRFLGGECEYSLVHALIDLLYSVGMVVE